MSDKMVNDYDKIMRETTTLCENTPHSFSTLNKDDLYYSLQCVLHKAYRQAAVGKGKERHADGEERFENQQIVEIGKRLQGNAAAGPLFQAVKKVYESGRLDADKAIHELLGAINYIAAAIIIRSQEKCV